MSETLDLDLGSADSSNSQRIGPYRIVRVLGEGGMGIVYLAEQKHPIRRRVALKVIKLGMNSREVMARFDSERQALALMDHPNIARVFDAGVSEHGQPYFAMEYVAGMHITEYCDEKRLNNRERVELFFDVCQAIQHAHQKGVIHRDIKPSNVLVGERDGKPFPRVIDFGIAKATDQRLAEYSAFTKFGQLLGTPEYMSPEQADLSGLDVDTTTDVYSLGVLLYQLLVGVLPFDAAHLRQAGLLELLRIIREDEPPSPANRLAGLRELEQIAANRRTDPATLCRQLAGDLNWIISKAIAKDKERRYASASDLAGDLQRYLTDQPVIARPPSASYHLQKFARRHRGLVTGLAAVFSVLVAGVTVNTVEAVRANRAEAVALVERDRALAADRASATATSLVLQNLLSAEGVDSDQLRKESRASSAVSQTEVDPGVAPALDRSSIERRLEMASRRSTPLSGANSSVDAATERVIGNAYVELKLYADAQRHLEQALELKKRMHIAGAPQDETESPATFSTMTDLGLVYSFQGNASQAEQLLAEVFRAKRRLLGPDHPETLQSESNLARFYFRYLRVKDAESLWREAAERSRRTKGSNDPFTRDALLSLAVALQEQNRFAEAEPLLETIRESGWRPPAGSPDLVDLEGRQYLGLRRYVEAESRLRETVADYSNLIPNNWELYISQSRLGESLAGQKKFGEAETLLLSGYEGMLELQHQNPQVFPHLRKRISQAGDRIVRLYRDWGKSGQAAEWERKLAKDSLPPLTPTNPK